MPQGLKFLSIDADGSLVPFPSHKKALTCKYRGQKDHSLGQNHDDRLRHRHSNITRISRPYINSFLDCESSSSIVSSEGSSSPPRYSASSSAIDDDNEGSMPVKKRRIKMELENVEWTSKNRQPPADPSIFQAQSGYNSFRELTRPYTMPYYSFAEPNHHVNQESPRYSFTTSSNDNPFLPHRPQETRGRTSSYLVPQVPKSGSKTCRQTVWRYSPSSRQHITLYKTADIFSENCLEQFNQRQ